MGKWPVGRRHYDMSITCPDSLGDLVQQVAPDKPLVHRCERRPPAEGLIHDHNMEELVFQRELDLAYERELQMQASASAKQKLYLTQGHYDPILWTDKLSGEKAAQERVRKTQLVADADNSVGACLRQDPNYLAPVPPTKAYSNFATVDHLAELLGHYGTQWEGETRSSLASSNVRVAWKMEWPP
ncbi:unnamed protein product [Chrysoparadoxa australica]